MLPLRILRDGQRQTVNLTLRRMPADEERVPPYIFGRGPDYAVMGGLVFQELSGPYMSTWGEGGRRKRKGTNGGNAADIRAVCQGETLTQIYRRDTSRMPSQARSPGTRFRFLQG